MTGTITVVNRFTPKAHPDVVRKLITRSASPVGNPFVVGDYGDRDACCDAYEKYVNSGQIWIENEAFVEWINERVYEYEDGKDIELVCGCWPKRCHGNTLRELIIDLANVEIPDDVAAEEEALSRHLEARCMEIRNGR
tara:strand:- start:625 stop:1038 length:414 start_codon:yes stop_codon:yes gene_type:complete